RQLPAPIAYVYRHSKHIANLLSPPCSYPTSRTPSPTRRSSHLTRQVVFEDARVPIANRLGDEGTGFTIAMKGLNGGRLNMGACSLGGAQWALDQTVAYLKERHAFGKPLAEQQALQFAVADMRTELEAARLMVARAASAIDNDEADVATWCAMAKRFATDVAFTAANSALQLHGGYGYLSEYGIEKVVRDLRVHQILEGTNEIMRLIIG